MHKQHARDLAFQARDAIAAAIRGAEDLPGVEVEAVSGAMRHALRGGRPIGPELLGLVAETITGAVNAVAELGLPVDRAARPIMIGALNGVRQSAVVTPETVRVCAATLVMSAADVGGEVSDAARGAVEGAMDAARGIGFSSEQAAVAAAAGALEAAAQIGVMAKREANVAIADTLFDGTGDPDAPMRAANGA